MIEAEFVECAAQFHALGARLAAAIGSDTAGRLAVDALPDVLAAVRQGELASCRLIERADRTGEYGRMGRHRPPRSSGKCQENVRSGQPAGWPSAERWQTGCRPR
jgi:hypothetical protein